MSEVYYGTKRISAEPQIREGNHGYRVAYEDGYVSWSPRSTFEDCYRKNGEMNFGHALVALNHRLRVARAAWSGKDQYLFKKPGSTSVVEADRPLAKSMPIGTRVEVHPYIAIKTAYNTIVPWTASQDDLLAEDWMTVI